MCVCERESVCVCDSVCVCVTVCVCEGGRDLASGVACGKCASSSSFLSLSLFPPPVFFLLFTVKGGGGCRPQVCAAIWARGRATGVRALLPWGQLLQAQTTNPPRIWCRREAHACGHDPPLPAVARPPLLPRCCRRCRRRHRSPASPVCCCRRRRCCSSSCPSSSVSCCYRNRCVGPHRSPRRPRGCGCYGGGGARCVRAPPTRSRPPIPTPQHGR